MLAIAAGPAYLEVCCLCQRWGMSPEQPSQKAKELAEVHPGSVQS